MSRTITAMFDSRSEAEIAREQLRQMGATAEIRDQSHLGGGSTGSSSGSFGSGFGGSTSSASTTTYDDSAGAAGGVTDRSASSGSSGRGFWADLKDAFVSDEDRYTYEEGVRRGGVLLTAHVDESRADEAIAILDREGTVDLDEREQSWRSEGWQGYQGSSSSAGMSSGSMSSGSQSYGSSSQGLASTGMASDTARQEEHIPIVEEQLRVGKREVTRGGARVRSYVEETPVTETVNLREEHVNIERRPVDQTLDRANLTGDVFQERTVEMTESAEEAVVAKEARVKEELVISKSATEHQEQIQDTVRHTEVDVDDTVGTDRDRLRSDNDRGAFFDKR